MRLLRHKQHRHEWTVIPRWLGLRNELKKLQRHQEVEAPVGKILDVCDDVRNARRDARTFTGFEERFKRQINCHHYAAYHLDPVINVLLQNTSKYRYLMPLGGRRIAMTHIRRWRLRSIVLGVRREASVSAMIVGKRLIRLTSGLIAWHLSLNWPIMPSDLLPLSSIRPSERDFSSLKRCQTRLRSNLTIERLNKLVFINMNAMLFETEDYRTTPKRLST